MKKILISYANDKMAFSLKRLGRQAKQLKLFDEIILYTPEKLPQYIKQSPLMKYSYGGGYWAWKPCVIYETLQNNEEDTVVCYVDAGCSLKKRIEWVLYFELMKSYECLCFKYRDNMPEWKKFGCEKTNIKYWAKKELLLFLDEIVMDDIYREQNKIWGGALFFKGKDNLFIKEWLDITINHPEMIIDPTKDELNNQYPFFALHKHDQPVLTALAYKYRNNSLVLPELSETVGKNVAIHATRCRAHSIYDYCWNEFKLLIRIILGNNAYSFLKRIIK